MIGGYTFEVGLNNLKTEDWKDEGLTPWLKRVSKFQAMMPRTILLDSTPVRRKSRP